jgi:hypothetical protein
MSDRHNDGARIGLHPINQSKWEFPYANPAIHSGNDWMCVRCGCNATGSIVHGRDKPLHSSKASPAVPFT